MPEIAEIFRAHPGEIELVNRTRVSLVGERTQGTYARVQRLVWRWLREHGIETLPCGVDAALALLLDYGDRGVTYGTLEHLRLALSRMHLEGGHEDVTRQPQVRRMMRVLKRRIGERPRDPAAPLRMARLEDLAIHLIERIAREGDPALRTRMRRDLAMIVVQWRLGLRHFQLLALHRRHIREERKGYLVEIPVEKGAPHGRGRRMPLYRDDDLRHICAVRALEEWLEVAQITDGPLFRPVVGRGGRIGEGPLSLRAYRAVVKQRAREAGFAGEELRRTRTHSMRRGVGTEMLAQGVPIERVQHHLAHASVRTTEGYIEREARLAEYPDPLAGLTPRRRKEDE